VAVGFRGGDTQCSDGSAHDEPDSRATQRLALHSAADLESGHLVERHVCGGRAVRQTHLERVGRERHDRTGASTLAWMSESHARAGRERLRGDDVREDEQTNDEGSDLTTHGITLGKSGDANLSLRPLLLDRASYVVAPENDVGVARADYA